MERIPISGPSISQKEIDYVTQAVTSAWYQDANVFHDRFEKAFAAYVGCRHAVALPSCTSALHLSLLALDVGPGDEVIVPDVTWIASAAPITYVGATPVFCDIDAQTWCLSAATVEACITPRTKAIIAVDLYGNLPDYDALRNMAAKHGIALIEDAAEAIGSTYQGRQAGSLGDTGVFSFHGSKTLTTGEGGMLVTDSEAIHQRVLVLRDHGRRPGDSSFFNSEIGYKYKMSSMQAALGLAQLERIEELVAAKRQIFAWYHQHLGDLPGVTLNSQAAGVRNTYWMVTALLEPRPGLGKEELMRALAARGVDSRPFFYPLSSLPAYLARPEYAAQAAAAAARNEVGYRLSPRGVNLPSGLNMTKPLVDTVCERLIEVLGSHGE